MINNAIGIILASRMINQRHQPKYFYVPKSFRLS